jgi:hypothetical protein
VLLERLLLGEQVIGAASIEASDHVQEVELRFVVKARVVHELQRGSSSCVRRGLPFWFSRSTSGSITLGTRSR